MRIVPLWIAVVLPATLVGHAVAYALAGQAADGSAHAWLRPAFELSLATLLVTGMLLFTGALLGAGDFKRSRIERSFLSLWPRLVLAQTVLFTAAETRERMPLTLQGIAVQVAVACCAALLVVIFSRTIARCAAAAAEISRYLVRQISGAPVLRITEPRPLAFALQARTGAHRFGRPPPSP